MFLSCPGDVLARALSLFSPEKGGRGQPPVNVRRVGERHKIVRETDYGLGVDARAGLGSPLSPSVLHSSVSRGSEDAERLPVQVLETQADK